MTLIKELKKKYEDTAGAKAIAKQCEDFFTPLLQKAVEDGERQKTFYWFDAPTVLNANRSKAIEWLQEQGITCERVTYAGDSIVLSGWAEKETKKTEEKDFSRTIEKFPANWRYAYFNGGNWWVF